MNFQTTFFTICTIAKLKLLYLKAPKLINLSDFQKDLMVILFYICRVKIIIYQKILKPVDLTNF